MSNQSLDYTGGYIETVGEVDAPSVAANFLMRGSVPLNFVQMSKNTTFKEAGTSDILKLWASSGGTSEPNILDTLSNAVRCSQENSDDLRVYLEYLAAIAFSLEKNDLAAKAIMRQEAGTVSPHMWAIAAAMKKQMPNAFYRDLLIAEGEKAKFEWSSQNQSI